MNHPFPPGAHRAIAEILHAEQQISMGLSEPYNSLVAPGDTVTAISASGRVMLGNQAVCNATVNVAQGNVREQNRFIQFISQDATEDMCYTVLKSGVEIFKEDGSKDELCWVITLVLKKLDGKWVLVHRHNTRAKP